MILVVSVPRRRPRLISATVNSSPSRYLWVSSSSISATASIIVWRCCSASARSSLGDVDHVDLVAQVVAVVDGLHLDEVDDALELVLAADRDLDRHGVGAEAVLDRVDAAPEVGAGAVELVDEAEARHAVAIGLAPDRLGLRLDTGDAIEDDDRAVEHAEAPLDLDREVHVPGRIDDVDTMVAPERGRCRGGDGDPPLLLLGHPVHRRRALMDLADLVDLLRVEEDPLGDGRLAGVDMRDDSDVPRLVRAEPVVPRSS